MSPRIRTFVLLLVFASVLAVPASASANWATLFSTSSLCGPGSPLSSTIFDDTTNNVPISWQNTNAPINLIGTGAIDHFEWKLTCAATPQTTATATMPGDGTWTFTHRAAETPTGPYTPWVDDAVMIDTTAPGNATSPAASWHKGALSVLISNQTPGGGLVPDTGSPLHGEWLVDGNPATDPFTATNTATINATGSHVLYTAVVDAAGNRTQRSHPVKVDDTIPTDSTTAPVGWQTDVAHITLTGADTTGTADQSGIANIVYQVDSGPETPAANGFVLDITANGSHTLKTKAVDLAGNESLVKSQIVQVDSAGPVDATTGIPSGWVRTSGSVSVSLQATDASGAGVTKIEWEIPEDSRSGTVNGAGPVPLTVTGERKHTLRVRYTDALNHVSQWYEHNIWIDTTLPLNDTTAPTDWVGVADLPVTVHGTDPSPPGSGVASVEWKIDNGPVQSAAGDTGTAHVTNTGEHTLDTRIIDVAGNVTAWASRDVKLDIAPPRNLTPRSSAGWITGSYTALVDGEDDNSGVAGVQWRVDGAAWNEGAPRVEMARVTGDGVRVLETRVRDKVGNYSNWRTDTVRIDSVKPTNTTVVPGSPVGTGHKIDVQGSDPLSGIGGQEWQLDGNPIKSTAKATITGTGPHTLKTRVMDNARNWSDWQTDIVTVDPSLPKEDSDAPLDTTSIPTEWQSGATFVSVSADDGDGTGVKKLEWRLDGLPIDSATVFNLPAMASFEVTGDGEHEIETRATDVAGNVSAWRTHTLKIDKTLPVDTTTIPASGWINTHAFTLSATDATSGVMEIEYRVDGGSVQSALADTVSLNLADGAHTLARRITDNADQKTGWKTETVNVDTSVPTNTSATPPTTWQTSALSLPLTGNDTGSGIDHFEWKLGSGTATMGSPAVVDVDGTSTLQTRVVDKAGNASNWTSDTVRVDRTKPSNTTPAVNGAWRKTNFTTSVSGTDATSGVQKIEWRVDGGAVSSTASVSITADGSHKLETRVTDVAGNVTDWRPDTVAIDKVAPTLSVNCGAVATWRKEPVDCSMTSDGGVSGLSALTATRGSNAAEAITGGHYVVDADGVWTINFKSVDGAGNEATAKADLKVDHSAPLVAVTCSPDAGLGYTCIPSGSDAGSGLSGLSVSVNGGAGQSIGNGAGVTVTKGTVVVTATDVAGNTGVSTTLTLADRTPPAPKPPTTTHDDDEITPRSTAEAVLLRKGASASARLLGQLAMSATPSKTTVDLRPLALGKGTFQFTIKVTYGKKSKTVKKTQATVKGYSKRISVSVPAAATAKVNLTVSRKSGKRWVSHASAHATL